MTTEITLTVITAVVVGLTQVAKTVGVPTRWVSLIALGFGLLLSLGLSLFQPTFTSIVTGLVIGLSAVGLYEVGSTALAGK